MKVYILFIRKSNQPSDLSVITEGKSNEIAYVKGDSGSKENKNAFLSFYGSSEYRRYNGKLGSTANFSYFCYDANDNLLFEFVDIGNRNLIQIRMNGKEITYQYE